MIDPVLIAVKRLFPYDFQDQLEGLKKKQCECKADAFCLLWCFLFVGLLLLVYFLLGVDCMLFLIFHVATHSSRVPTSGSQTGDTLGKALASVSVKDVVVGNPTHVLNQCWYNVTICTSLKHWSRGAGNVHQWFPPPINRINYFADLPHR